MPGSLSAQITPLQGTMVVPGDKSISHRALLLSALCPGISRITGLADNADVRSTWNALVQLGVLITSDNGETIVRSTSRLSEPSQVLDVGNAGTTLRLLTGVLAAQKINAVITGDDSLRRRPMKRVIDPLNQMGASVSAASQNQFAPVTIQPPAKLLHGITYTLPVPTAQVKSAILLAGLFAHSDTRIIEPVPCRDHTERLFQYMGVLLTRKADEILLLGGQAEYLQPVEISIPGDFSSAAFLMSAALLIRGSSLRLPNICLNPTRIGLIQALRHLGGRIQLESMHESCGETVGDIVVEASQLKGNLTLRGEDIPSLIDEIPLLAVAGIFLEGTLRVTGAQELRYKESDRIQVLAQELAKAGVALEILHDGFVLQGNPDFALEKVSQDKAPEGLDSHGDHRIAMALSVLNRVVSPDQRWEIRGQECVGISFPRFFEGLWS